MKSVLVLGARPQIIKSAPIIYAASSCPELGMEIVHTGQHYDYEMSKLLFDEMSLPEPVANLEVGSGPHGWQTGKMVIEIERCLLSLKPDVVVVPGDTNSTLAGALAAAKLHMKVAHVEAGARSYDMRMPEEVNRKLTDHCSDILFAVSDNSVRNLQNEGVNKAQIFKAGDTMYDALLQHLPKVQANPVLERLELEKQEYAVLTTHRPENVDSPSNLASIVQAMTKLKRLTIVFPAHPRTKKRLEEAGLIKCVEKVKHIMLIPPVGYHEMLKLIKNARMLFTDSGGMQKESFWLHTPCITLRENTEWTETVELGANVLVGTDRKLIVERANDLLQDRSSIRQKRVANPYGDGKASTRIVEILACCN